MKSNAAVSRKSRRAKQGNNDNVIPMSARRAQKAAARTNRREGEIQRLPFDLSALDEEGIFINVDASGFGLLNRRLDWRALGINLPKETDVVFHPPRCGVLPNRYRRPLLTPAAQVHAALRQYSYQFRLTETLFQSPAYRWVPWRAFGEFEKSFDSANARLDDAKQIVLGNYDQIRAEVLETFRRLADDSAQRLLATGIVVEADFRERIMNGVLDALPSEEEVRHKLQLRYQVGVFLLGSEMLRERRLALKERHRIARIEARRDLERREEGLARAAVQQRLWAEAESARLKLAAEEREHEREEAAKERIRQLKVEAAREKLQESLSPLQEGAAQLRAQIYESAVSIHEALAKNDFLPGSSAKKARSMARWFRLMNFQSDAELERLVTSLEGLAAKREGKNKRSAGSGEVKAVLDDIIELCYRDAQALTQPSRLSALEL